MKNLRSRIRSANSTLQLTKAMGLVASSKIRRALTAMTNGREYAAAFEEAIRLLTSSPDCARSPYMMPRETDRTRLIVIAGDRGMAGGYNANLFRLAATFPDAQKLPIGKRACDRFGGELISSEHFSAADASEWAKKLCEDFVKGEYDRLGILHTRYVSMMTQEPVVSWILPLTAEKSSGSTAVLFEPGEREVLDTAVPSYVTGQIMAAVRESFACEVAARRTAMDAAGKNAQQMIDELQLAYNRARQGAITQEITEIVAGGNA